MRRRSARAAAVTLAALGVLAGPVLPSSPASAETTTVPVTIDSAAENTSSVSVPVPAGISPTAVTGVLNMTETPAGTVEFLVNGRSALVVPATLYAKVSIPVAVTDVSAQDTIGLALRFVPAAAAAGTAAATCVAPTSTSAVLRKIGLTYTGTETAPTTLSTFFPDQAAGITVTVPPNAGDDLLAAGLAAVASLSARYPDDTPVALATNDEPITETGAGYRVVALSGGGSTVTTSVLPPSAPTTDPAADPASPAATTVPTITITGSGDALVSAARALGTEAMDLATTASTDDLSVTPQTRDVGLTRTLTQLDASGLSVSGWGESTAHVDVRQDSFGGPVSGLAVKLVGTHTALPAGASAQVDVFFNGTLVESQALSDETDLDLAFTVPAGVLLSENDLDIQLTALPEGGCLPSTPQLPLELTFDPQQSTIVGTRGVGNLVGFQALPQSFEGSLAVGLRPTGARRTTSAIEAAALVSALQRTAAAPLDVELISADELLAGKEPGLLVGASYTDSVALAVPLRFSGTRLLDNVDAQMQIGTNEPFGALESVRNKDRDILALGSWSPNAGGIAPPLSRKIITKISTEGWRNLTGDVLLADASDNPVVSLRSNPAEKTSMRASDTDDDSNGLARYFVFGILVLLVILGLQLWSTLRRSRRARDLAATEERDHALDGASYDDGTSGR